MHEGKLVSSEFFTGRGADSKIVWLVFGSAVELELPDALMVFQIYCNKMLKRFANMYTLISDFCIELPA